MKTQTKTTSVHLPHLRKASYSLLGSMTALAASLALLGGPSIASAQSDDFNDGNDTSPTIDWTRNDPISTIFSQPAQNTWSFPGGNSYRFQATPSPAPGSVGPARVSSFAPDIYTDFYQSVDVVAVNNTAGFNVFGMLARAGDFSTAGAPTSRGYGFVYIPGSVYGDRDYIAIFRLRNDTQTSGVPGSTGGNAEVNVTLDPAKQYRMVFIGRGTHLEGRVYELTDLTTPIAVVSGNTAGQATQHASGQSGLFAFSAADNPVTGLYKGPVDVTFDNYYAAEDCPDTSYSDNFDDGNDTLPATAWAHYDPLFGVSSTTPAGFTFPGGGYRIVAPVPDSCAASPARGGSMRGTANYGSFYVSVDLIDWDDTQRQVFGVFARGATVGLGTTDGYLFSYELGGGTLPNTTGGDLDMVPLLGEAPIGQIETNSSSIHLTKGKHYRMTFSGAGNFFTGRIYDLANPTTALITVLGTDDVSPTPYTSGQVGLVVASQGNCAVGGDATFDNFFADVAAPILTFDGSSGSPVITWPGNLTCIWVLESSPTIGPSAVWTEVATSVTSPITFNPTTVLNTYSASDPMNSTTDTFYRLRKL